MRNQFTITFPQPINIVDVDIPPPISHLSPDTALFNPSPLPPFGVRLGLLSLRSIYSTTFPLFGRALIGGHPIRRIRSKLLGWAFSLFRSFIYIESREYLLSLGAYSCVVKLTYNAPKRVTFGPSLGNISRITRQQHHYEHRRPRYSCHHLPPQHVSPSFERRQSAARSPSKHPTRIIGATGI